MKRTLIVIALALGVLALLIGAAVKSRAVPLSAHLAQQTLAADLDDLAANFETLVASLDTAWRLNQTPGEAVGNLRQRIAASLPALGQSIDAIPAGGLERERIDSSLVRLEAAVTSTNSLATSLQAQLTNYSRSLELIRSSGPNLVREFREQGQERTGSDLFELIAATIAFAAPNAVSETGEIRRLIVTLQRDLGIEELPPGGTSLIAAAELILATKNDARNGLEQLAGGPLPEYAEALEAATESAYLGAIASAGSAQLMLSIYAILMLLAVAFIGLRLQASYRALNRANAELETLNTSLEQRVVERTEDLSDALTELRESQVQLVQAEKMSSLGQLVAGISHEINTPLLYLSNNASLIQERGAALSRFVAASARVLNPAPGEHRDRSEYQAKLVEGLRTLKILLRDEELAANTATL
jgi:signal transduction histidine kinase